MITKITQFYLSKNIPFFLFAPQLTFFNTLRTCDCTAIVTSVSIVYDNGAVVNTSFLTNLEKGDVRIRTAPTLYQAVKKSIEHTIKMTKKQLPKYEYPINVINAPRIASYAKYGIDFKVKKSDCFYVSKLDSQKEKKKAIFGGGFLLSDNAAAEREKAEREKAERWTLSEREKEIVKNLGRENK